MRLYTIKQYFQTCNINLREIPLIEFYRRDTLSLVVRYKRTTKPNISDLPESNIFVATIFAAECDMYDLRSFKNLTINPTYLIHATIHC